MASKLFGISTLATISGTLLALAVLFLTTSALDDIPPHWWFYIVAGVVVVAVIFQGVVWGLVRLIKRRSNA